jgi:hypothetical protein
MKERLCPSVMSCVLISALRRFNRHFAKESVEHYCRVTGHPDVTFQQLMDCRRLARSGFVAIWARAKFPNTSKLVQRLDRGLKLHFDLSISLAAWLKEQNQTANRISEQETANSAPSLDSP